MVNVPPNNATQEQKIQYVKNNFGEGIAQDLLEAAGSGTIPVVLKEFLQGKITPEIPSNRNRIAGTHLSQFLYLRHDSSNYDKTNKVIDNKYNVQNSNGHEQVEQSIIKAIETGNKDFLQAFIADSTTIKEFVNSSSSKKELPLKMVETAIKNDQIETLNLLLNNEYIYIKASNPYPATTGNWGKEVENTHNKILDLVTKYASSNPDSVAHVMKDERVNKDFETEIERADALKTAVASLSQQTNSPKITETVLTRNIGSDI